MFDGTGDPRQHVAHFLSRCGPIAQNEALCLQLFVQSLESSAFTWYANLPEGSILNWDFMVKEFLKQFCNTQRRVGVPKLIETKQCDNESVTDFIARWRALTFACPQKFTQLELIRMCFNNFRHELSTALMAQTFEGFNDLCTKAHDMELHLAKRRRPRAVERVEPSTAATIETRKKGQGISYFSISEKARYRKFLRIAFSIQLYFPNSSQIQQILLKFKINKYIF